MSKADEYILYFNVGR